MIPFIIGVVFTLVVGAYAVGVRTGSDANPPTISRPPNAEGSADCQQACAEWDHARQMQCSAKADEVAARSRADGIRSAALAALAGAIALAVGGAAALAAAAAATATIFGIPAGVVLTGVAIALFALAAAAFLVADGLFGQLGAAERDAADKASARQAWDAEVVRARSAVNSNCSPAEANQCLSRAAPC